MMNFQSKFSEIAPTQVRPPKSAIFPDHPHPTMLVEGGQEPGDGPGWKSGNIKKYNKEGIEEERYKAKQRELYLVGSESERLSFERLMLFDARIFELSFVNCLPDIILFDPNDEGIRSVYPRRGWTRHNRRSTIIYVAFKRDIYQKQTTSLQRRCRYDK